MKGLMFLVSMMFLVGSIPMAMANDCPQVKASESKGFVQWYSQTYNQCIELTFQVFGLSADSADKVMQADLNGKNAVVKTSQGIFDLRVAVGQERSSGNQQQSGPRIDNTEPEEVVESKTINHRKISCKHNGTTEGSKFCKKFFQDVERGCMKIVEKFKARRGIRGWGTREFQSGDFRIEAKTTVANGEGVDRITTIENLPYADLLVKNECRGTFFEVAGIVGGTATADKGHEGFFAGVEVGVTTPLILIGEKWAFVLDAQAHLRTTDFFKDSQLGAAARAGLGLVKYVENGRVPAYGITLGPRCDYDGENTEVRSGDEFGSPGDNSKHKCGIAPSAFVTLGRNDEGGNGILRVTTQFSPDGGRDRNDTNPDAMIHVGLGGTFQ